MNIKERLEAVYSGRKPDRIPWIPRLKIWYLAHKAQGILPKEFIDLSLREIEKKLHLGTPARDGKIYMMKYNNIEIREEIKDDKLYKHYNTPEGVVTEVYKININAREKDSPFAMGRIENLIKKVGDYKILEYIIKNIHYLPDYDKYIRYEKEIGEDGIPLVNCGVDPMFLILHEFIGYNNCYYELYDHPRELKRLYEVCYEKQLELLEIISNSPAKVILYGSHYDSMMTPPPIFNEFIKPFLKIYSEKLHQKGKIHAIHADAESLLLLESFRESGIDMVECFATAPLVRCTLEDAINAWGSDMIIWGGIPSTLLNPINYSEEEFIQYLNEILHLINKKEVRIILGVSDNVMPEADINRIKMITELIK